jgi:hypothetical protein
MSLPRSSTSDGGLDVMRHAPRDGTVLPRTRAEAVLAASGESTPTGTGPLVREIGQSIALLAGTGVSVGGVLGVVVVAAHVLGR